MSRKIDESRSLAVYYHKGQKYGEHNYMYHIEKVVQLAKIYFPHDNRHVIVAYLHDAVEDTQMKIEEIEFKFGEEIANQVYILTDPDGKNRKEIKKKSHEKLKNADNSYLIGLGVKILDRMANVQEGIKTGNIKKLAMYEKEREEFMSSIYRPELQRIFNDLDKTMNEAKQLLSINLDQIESKKSKIKP